MIRFLNRLLGLRNDRITNKPQTQHRRTRFETLEDRRVLAGLTSVPVFDEQYYLATNPDVAANVGASAPFTSGRDHYLKFGQFEGRNPIEYFDEKFYLRNNPDVAANVGPGKTFASGFQHFEQFGQFEGRNPSLMFDEKYYLRTYPDVAANAGHGKAFASGFDHYRSSGQYEGRNPNSQFDERFYLRQNPDVAANIAQGGGLHSGFDHYYRFGQYEERNPGPLFDERFYALVNPDVAANVGPHAAFTSGLEHYLLFGQYEGRFGAVPFDETYYLRTYPDIAANIGPSKAFGTGFEHYLHFGRNEHRSAVPWLNESYYLQTYPDVVNATGSGRVFAAGLEHYVLYGQYEQRSNRPLRFVNLTANETAAVQTTLSITRGTQLPDGAFTQVFFGSGPTAPVYIRPYFASYGALALLAGNDWQRSPADVAAVGRWLQWCAAHQSDQGYWNDFGGTVANYGVVAPVDAFDSSAATFLMVLGRYHQAGGLLTPELVHAARKAFDCIKLVTASDGLTWAAPTYHVKYLMDNIEVYAGLRAAHDVFLAAHLPELASQANAQADTIGSKLPSYWMPADNIFAYAQFDNGTFDIGNSQRLYPRELAQLFGIAFVTPRENVFTNLAANFLPSRGQNADVGVEKWLMAASRLNANLVAEWRAKLVAEIATFTPLYIEIQRTGMATLVLLEGADWIPNVESGT